MHPEICVRMYACFREDVSTCDAGHVLDCIKNLQEEKKRGMLSAFKDTRASDNIGAHV